MASKLRPCGTYAAYRRHLRNNETPCEPCKQASRDQANVRHGLKARADEVPVVEIAPDPEEDFDVPTPYDDAVENLRLVNAAMAKAVPREVAPLSKRRQELVQLLAELGSNQEASLHDQLAEARAARAARA